MMRMKEWLRKNPEYGSIIFASMKNIRDDDTEPLMICTQNGR